MNNKTILWIIIVVLVIAFIILPTGTPEDLITTVPIFGAIGWKKFLIISIITIGIVAIVFLIINNNKSIKEMLQQKNIIA